MIRRDLRNRIRRRLKQYDADFFTEDELNDWIGDEIRGMLPQLFKTGFDTSLTTQTTNNEYTIPSGVDKVLEFWYKDGDGNYTNEIKIKRQFASTLFLSNTAGESSRTIRLFVRKAYTVPTTDTETLEVEDNKLDIIIYGVMATSFEAAISFALDKETYKSRSEPSISDASALSRQADKFHSLKALAIRKALPSQYARTIDLVSN